MSTKRRPRTVYDSTDDRLDLAFLAVLCGCIAREVGDEGLLDGLESTANSRRAAEAGAGAQDPAKTIALATHSSSIGFDMS